MRPPGLLVRLGGAVATRVPDAGNLAHLDNPVALADLVRPAKEER